jgi:hypothetical protein
MRMLWQALTSMSHRHRARRKYSNINIRLIAVKHDLALTSFVLPITLRRPLASSIFYGQDDEDPCFDHLDNKFHLPWDQSSSNGGIEVAAQENCLSWTDTFSLDCCIDRHEHVSLQDLELHDMARRPHDEFAEVDRYGDETFFGYGAIGTRRQDADTVILQAVPHSLVLPSKHNHGRRHGHNGDDRRIRSGPRFRPNAVIRDWYFTHSSSPYPSPDVIAALATLSSRSERQVKICLSNLRARAKEGEHSRLMLPTICV